MIDLTIFHPEKAPRTPIGTADLFSRVFWDQLVYVPERKSFFVYDGCVWVQDKENLKAHQLLKEMVVSLLEYFKNAESNEIWTYYAKYLNRGKRCDLLEDAKGNHTLSMSEFDKSPLLLNCLNGTLDLIRGIRPHRAEDYLTKVANVVYDEKANSERFEQFISDIMQGNPALINYMQKVLGYSISGMSTEECFFIWFGATTRNGKGTLNNIMTALLGDYATTAQYETFASKKYGTSSGASEDIARLAGARYVAVSEPADNMVLNSALIKTLSGNDRITARYMYENSFEFTAHFKIMINTNHLPAIPDESVFTSGRVKVIPFSRHFAEEEQDKGLKAELTSKEALSGILNWLLTGFEKVVAEGLREPQEVIDAVNKYRKENDRIGEFIEDCLVQDTDNRNAIAISTLYKVYTHWCVDNGCNPYSKNNFTRKLKDRIPIIKLHNQNQIKGWYIEPNIPVEWKLAG